ncbi:MAG: hypothetical protein V1767_05070 [Chloroflexota bacterium]
MDILIRTIAIVIEVSILAAIIYCLLKGVFLIIFDLGISDRYRKMITVALTIAGILIVVFFISHLTSFYPTIGTG